MLDIAFIKENPDIIRAAIQNKHTEPVDIDRLLKAYEERKALQQEIDDLNREKNQAATERDFDRGKQIKVELQAVQEKFKEIDKEYSTLMLQLPNIPSPDTPVGKDESENKVLREVGEEPKFSFTPKPHWEIGEKLGIIDTQTAGDVSGARFNYLKGDAARLQYALFNFGMNTVTDNEILKEIAERADVKVPVTSFVPVVPPLMMRTSVMNRMARLHPMDERYVFEKDDLVLIGSAEHTLGPLHMDEKIDESALPLRYVAYTPAFRREAGTYGKDTRGIIRQHQFDKIEMETFVNPENGYAEQDFILAIQEYILQKLELPYHVVSICTGDMGTPDQRQFDMDTWMPGQGIYKETHTSDYMGGYQSRRLNTRVKREDGTTEAIHMNDATLIAMGRTIAAILENYQQEDGTVRVPKVLQQYMGKEVIDGSA